LKMNMFGRTIIALFLAAVMLASCNGFRSTPTMSPADIMETAIATVSTAFAETQRAIPTNTPISLPTFSLPTTTPTSVPTSRPLPTPLVFTDPSIPLSERIVYYYFVQGAFHFVPEGSVLTPILLFPAASDETYTSNTAADLRTALEIVLHDSQNWWISSDLEIVDVTFRNGHADMVLRGEYFGESDKVLSAASMQILLTVFANPSVQTAAVTLNGDTIGNLGVSSSTNAKPADYVYTRAEIETYLKEHAYVLP
jgi:hypothetical protein